MCISTFLLNLYNDIHVSRKRILFSWSIFLLDFCLLSSTFVETCSNLNTSCEFFVLVLFCFEVQSMRKNIDDIFEVE